MKGILLTKTPPHTLVSQCDLSRLQGWIFKDNHKEISFLDSPEFIVMVEYNEILEDDFIAKADKFGCEIYNIHRANPRHYRGASVVNHQILNDETFIWVTISRVRPNTKVDCGPIVAGAPVSIEKKFYYEIVQACREKYRELIDSVLGEEYEYGQHYMRRKPEDSELKLTEEQINIIRASDNVRFPAFFMYGGRKIRLTAQPESPL